jgi:hypothetical protein
MTSPLIADEIDLGSTTPADCAAGVLNVGTAATLPKNAHYAIDEIVANFHEAAVGDVVIEDGDGTEYFRAHLTTRGAHTFKRPNVQGLGKMIGKKTADSTLILRFENCVPVDTNVSATAKVVRAIDNPNDVPTRFVATV